MPQNTNANGTAQTVVSVPPAAGSPHAFLFNGGMNTAWLGGAGVSTSTGFPLPANNRIDLSAAPGTIWAIAGGSTVSPSGTLSANSTSGGTTLTLSAGGTAFTGGMTIVIEAGSVRQEINSVLSSQATAVQTAGPMSFQHLSTAVFSQYVPNVTTLQVTRGAT